MIATQDEGHMARALDLAERGRATARPNPVVGCVIVRDGQVVGEGWHERAGGPHAEVVALEAAGDAARGATAYVTLEPCAHAGRTGPCANALIAAGVARVVYATADPSPDAGGGAAVLEAAGVEVVGGLLQGRAAAQNEVFLHAARLGRPHVTLKLAQSLDGALVAPGRRWLTSQQARQRVHAQRAQADAVLVGVGTVLADDPLLDVRHVAAPAGQPRPVILDAGGRTPTAAAVIRPGALVFTTAASAPAWRDALIAAGAEPVVVAPANEGGVALPEVLDRLYEREVRSVYAEGGATVAAALVAARLVDRLVLHVARQVIAGSGLPRTTPAVVPGAGAGWHWSTRHTESLGPDLEIVAVPLQDGER